jgi:hypothetical protein
MVVTDVLISARLFSQTHPAITLSRMITERDLKRRIYVDTPEKLCIEPDASCEFLTTENGHNGQQTRVRDFFHIEVYRNLPPVERRFKQKIAGYVTYVDTGQHQALFNTSALSIAVISISKPMAATLKRWTEQVLQEMGRPEEGDWFFFCSLDPATASPEELFLSPLWEQAFSTTKTPLLMLENDA